jgi:hypothetical protein
LEQTLTQSVGTEHMAEGLDTLAKLQRQYSDVVQIDYFDSPEGVLIAAQLARLAQALNPDNPPEPAIAAADLAGYRDKHWVTRPQPHVDRLACIWLIRRFINPDAVIRYALQPEATEISFDMPSPTSVIQASSAPLKR